MSFPVEAATERAGLRPGRLRLAALLEVIHQRQAYRRALRRGEPHVYAAD
jgi:glutathione S-transferase